MRSEAIEKRGGNLPRVEQQRLSAQSGPLAVRKDGKYTGVKKELRESQSLGMWNLSRRFSFRTYTDEFGAWISLCFQSYGLGRCSTDPCRLPRDVSSESTDYELFMKHCVDGEGWIIGDEWCDAPCLPMICVHAPSAGSAGSCALLSPELQAGSEQPPGPLGEPPECPLWWSLG